MKWFLLVLLTTVPLGVLSQVTLDQPASEVLKPSQTLSLTCKVSGFSIQDSNYAWNWIRQPPGKGLEWLARIYYDGRTWYSADLQSRLKITKDTSSPKNEYSLQMSGMKPEDTATYYCSRDNYWGAMDYWGQGTLVTVSSVLLAAPSVFPLIPCCTDLENTEEVSVGCLVTGYMPEPIKVTWNSNSEGKTFQSVLGSTSSLYTTSSHLTISGSAWRNTSYQCSVLHEKTGLKQSKAIQVLPCTVPVVKALHESPCEDFHTRSSSNSTMDLVCQMTHFFPESIQAHWLVNGKKAKLPASPLATWKDKNGYFSASSYLRVSRGQWNQGALYTCVVEQPSTRFTTQVNVSKCSESCDEDLQVHLLPPSFEDLYLEHTAKLTCLVTNIRNTENFEITWTKATGSKLDQLTSDLQLQDNGTYSTSNVASICAEDWESGETFTCTVKYQEKPAPITKSISKDKEVIPRQPSVYLFPPSTDEVALQEKVSLTCLVKGFKPKDIVIKWLHEGTEMGKENYITTEPIQSQDNNFFQYSHLVIDSSDWNKGNSYTCVVGHEALPMYLTQKSIDKSTGKPSMVNVSLVMSESATTCY